MVSFASPTLIAITIIEQQRVNSRVIARASNSETMNSFPENDTHSPKRESYRVTSYICVLSLKLS